MRILIYTGAFNRILIGCIAALNDGRSTHAVLVGVCFFLPFFVFFCTLTSALCVDVVQKLSH